MTNFSTSLARRIAMSSLVPEVVKLWASCCEQGTKLSRVRLPRNRPDRSGPRILIVGCDSQLPRSADVVHSILIGVAGPVRRAQETVTLGIRARPRAAELMRDPRDFGIRHAPSPLGLQVGRWRYDQRHGLSPLRVVEPAVPRILRGTSK